MNCLASSRVSAVLNTKSQIVRNHCAETYRLQRSSEGNTALKNVIPVAATFGQWSTPQVLRTSLTDEQTAANTWRFAAATPGSRTCTRGVASWHVCVFVMAHTARTNGAGGARHMERFGHHSHFHSCVQEHL